jgi:hypothetical protein
MVTEVQSEGRSRLGKATHLPGRHGKPLVTRVADDRLAGSWASGASLTLSLLDAVFSVEKTATRRVP